MPLDQNKINTWTITPLEFDKNFIDFIESETSLDDSTKHDTANHVSGMVYYEFEVDLPSDTYLATLDKRLSAGQVFLNGKNLGRYNKKGPQRSLYIPKSWLVDGINKIAVYDEWMEMKKDGSYPELQFSDHMIYNEDL